MIDEQAFVAKGSQLIHNTAMMLDLVHVGGAANWLLKVTPRSVKKTREPSMMTPRAEILFDLNHGVKVLDSHTVTSYGQKITLHLYEGGLKFPPQDNEYLTTQDHKVIELAIFKQGWGKRELTQLPGEKAKDFSERSARYSEAFGSDRYWFAIPSLFDERSVHIANAGKKAKLFITDRKYARQVAELNHLEGGLWMSESHRKKLRLAIILSILFSLIFCLVPFSLIDTIMSYGKTWYWITAGVSTVLIIMVISLLMALLPKRSVEPL